MNYLALKQHLERMDARELMQTVTVKDPYTNEYTAVVDITETDDQVDALDPGHVVLVLKA